MKVLVACEFSGIVSKAFRDRGHFSISCDLLDSEMGNEFHYKGSALDILDYNSWDLVIAHPPCTHLAVSGNRWYHDKPELIRDAVEFVQAFYYCGVSKVCIENPVGRLSTLWRKPDQYIQPWQFGHDASKKTGLWLKNLPKLEPTDIIIKERYANQTPSGQNKLGPSATRAQERSRTYEGIARAMAEQWG